MWLLDDEIETVYSVSRSQVLRRRGIDTPDFFVSIIQFKKGAVATLENGWILPNTAPNIIDFKVEIVGSDGVLYIDGSHNRILEKYTKGRATYPDVLVCPILYGRPMGFGVESIRHFIDCIVNDKQPLVGAKEGEIVTRVIVAIHESAKIGKVVKVD